MSIALFGGAFVVDDYTLVFQGFFLAAAWVSMLLSVDYIGDGDYYQGEFWFLLVSAVLGMVVMASARDLITIFVALETISIPTFVLAGWRKHDSRSNEAAVKYFIIGVLSSAVMLYGMSMVYGLAGTTSLAGIGRFVAAVRLWVRVDARGRVVLHPPHRRGIGDVARRDGGVRSGR